MRNRRMSLQHPVLAGTRHRGNGTVHQMLYQIKFPVDQARNEQDSLSLERTHITLRPDETQHVAILVAACL